MSERAAWIALASTPGVGDVTFARLLEIHGTATAALSAVDRLPAGRADRALSEMLRSRLRPGVARAIQRAAGDLGRTERAVHALDGWTLTPLDVGYPSALRSIEEPPNVLYGLGDQASLRSEPLVAVVGTRRPTAEARDLATRIGWTPAPLHLVLTGRDAHPEVIERADTVSEVREIKHAYRKGIEPQPGIDY